jgi:formylmethanofuran dehydrogenase subunit D
MAAVVTIVTFKDIFQDEAEKKSRYSDEYRTLSAQIILDQQDMANLGAKDGQSVLVENDIGSIVVAAKTSDDDSHSGLAFMIKSPWSNQLVKDDACDTSIPGFKGISAQVSLSGENVTSISELFQRMKA